MKLQAISTLISTVWPRNVKFLRPTSIDGSNRLWLDQSSLPDLPEAFTHTRISIYTESSSSMVKLHCMGRKIIVPVWGGAHVCPVPRNLLAAARHEHASETPQQHVYRRRMPNCSTWPPELRRKRRRVNIVVVYIAVTLITNSRVK